MQLKVTERSNVICTDARKYIYCDTVVWVMCTHKKCPGDPNNKSNLISREPNSTLFESWREEKKSNDQNQLCIIQLMQISSGTKELRPTNGIGFSLFRKIPFAKSMIKKIENKTITIIESRAFAQNTKIFYHTKKSTKRDWKIQQHTRT